MLPPEDRQILITDDAGRGRGSNPLSPIGASVVTASMRPDRVTCQQAVEAAELRLVGDPDLVSFSWQVYAVKPMTVEF